MKLRWRFTVGFALAAVVPIALAAFGTREVLSNNYREGFARQQRAAESLAKQELARLKSELDRQVASIVQPDGFYVGGLLLETEKNGGRLQPPVLGEVLGRLREQGTVLIEGLGLDVFMVLDGNAEVLFAPHYRPAQHEIQPQRTAVAAKTEGAPIFALERILEGDQIRQELVIEAIRTAGRDGVSATVMGGRVVDRDLLAALLQDEAVSARVVDTDGKVVVAMAERAEMTPAAWTQDALRLPLRGAGGEPVAWIEMVVSKAELRQVLRQVTMLATGLGAAGLVITVLLGLWVAGRMTRDLDELVSGAQAASRGDLDHQVPVRTGDEIGAVADAFNTMMVDLKDSKERLVLAERIAAWQEIARRLAHEIKNPLTPIQMSVETLRKTWAGKHPSFDEIFEESTQTVLEEAGRLKRIVGEFSEFARLPKPSIQAIDLNAVVGAALALYQGSAEVSLERTLAGDLPTIEGDKDQLTQVLYNLLENARDAALRGATERPPSVTVETARVRAGKALSIVIEDSGPGVDPGLRGRIFTPYFTTKHESGGTGLGLAIAQRIVIDHGGRITVGTATLGGARFTIELPLTPQPT